MWDQAPVVITVAPVGAEVSRADHPGVPHTPREIAAATHEAAQAGATLVHLHVREEDGAPSGDPALFQETVALIKARCPIITAVSTGGAVGMSIGERCGGLHADPELAGVETGSLNFFDEVFVTSPPDGRGIIAMALERGVGLEVEAFDVGHVIAAVRLHEEGDLPGTLRVNLVFGVPGGIDASPEALAAMLRPLPASAVWTVTAVGRHQRRMLALAVALGANGIRVGFEDNVFLRRGELAQTNAQLVDQAARMIQAQGRPVATQAEARRELGLAAR